MITISRAFAHLSPLFHYVTIEPRDDYYLVKVWEEVPHLLNQGWMSLAGEYDSWVKVRSLPEGWTTTDFIFANDLIGE